MTDHTPQRAFYASQDDRINVAVLFARPHSIYHTLPACDVWDKTRDALKWPGGMPVVAHPPCRSWTALAHFSKPEPGEHELAPWAIDQVRRYGGVLEHPRRSNLWRALNLPAPGRGRDPYGGWTLPIRQHDWGHRAEKLTFLYICGVDAAALPPLPLNLSEAPSVIGTSSRRSRGAPAPRPEVSRAARQATPPLLAAWLVLLAQRTRHPEHLAE